MLLKQQNVLADDVQSGGDNVLSPTIIKNVDLSAPEVPSSEVLSEGPNQQDPTKILDPDPYIPSPVLQKSPISPIPFELQSPITPDSKGFIDKNSFTEQGGDGLSPTVVLNDDGLSPTVVMSRNKLKKRISDQVSITDLGTDEQFRKILPD
jgi:hypothetical protein